MVNKIKFRQGDILEIPLSGSLNGYGRILKQNKSSIYIELYKLKPTCEIRVENLSNVEHILKLWTGPIGIKIGLWRIIGNIPVEDEVIAPETWNLFLFRDMKLPPDQPLGLFGYENVRVKYAKALAEVGLCELENLEDNNVAKLAADIFDEDLPQDIQIEFDRIIAKGDNVNAAVNQIFERFAEAIVDTDDRPIIYLAIAKLLLRQGEMIEDIRGKALEIIDLETDLERWKDAKPEMYSLRKRILEELKVSLLQS